jgi:DNA-binding MarR family transcriptional regulator
MDTNGASNGKHARRRSVYTWMRLARVFQKVNRASTEQLRAWDLSVAQFDVLAQLGSDEGITQQELADRLLVTKGNVCQLLDRMQQSGLITRRQEGRANHLFLTPTGHALFKQVVPAHEACIAEQLESLSREEQDILLGLLRRLDHALN